MTKLTITKSHDGNGFVLFHEGDLVYGIRFSDEELARNFVGWYVLRFFGNPSLFSLEELLKHWNSVKGEG